MITEKELNPKWVPLDEAQKNNFTRLLFVMQAIRKLYGQPMIVTSGVRSAIDQARIDIAAGRKPRLGSAHLKAAACDIADPHGAVKRWVKENEGAMVGLGVYLEDFAYTPGWVHFQIYAPRSGKRYFIP